MAFNFKTQAREIRRVLDKETARVLITALRSYGVRLEAESRRYYPQELRPLLAERAERADKLAFALFEAVENLPQKVLK